MALGKLCCLGNVKFAFQTYQLQGMQSIINHYHGRNLWKKNTLKHNLWQRTTTSYSALANGDMIKNTLHNLDTINNTIFNRQDVLP